MLCEVLQNMVCEVVQNMLCEVKQNILWLYRMCCVKLYRMCWENLMCSVRLYRICVVGGWGVYKGEAWVALYKDFKLIHHQIRTILTVFWLDFGWVVDLEIKQNFKKLTLNNDQKERRKKSCQQKQSSIPPASSHQS